MLQLTRIACVPYYGKLIIRATRSNVERRIFREWSVPLHVLQIDSKFVSVGGKLSNAAFHFLEQMIPKKLCNTMWEIKFYV